MSEQKIRDAILVGDDHLNLRRGAFGCEACPGESPGRRNVAREAGFSPFAERDPSDRLDKAEEPDSALRSYSRGH